LKSLVRTVLVHPAEIRPVARINSLASPYFLDVHQPPVHSNTAFTEKAKNRWRFPMTPVNHPVSTIEPPRSPRNHPPCAHHRRPLLPNARRGTTPMASPRRSWVRSVQRGWVQFNAPHHSDFRIQADLVTSGQTKYAVPRQSSYAEPRDARLNTSSLNGLRGALGQGALWGLVPVRMPGGGSGALRIAVHRRSSHRTVKM